MAKGRKSRYSKEILALLRSDLEDDRLDFPEIAAIRLGDPKKHNVVGYYAQKWGFTRKDRRGKRNGSQKSKVSKEKSDSEEIIENLTFEQKTRLELIDAALSRHKGLLLKAVDPYKMDRWSAALDRLLEQRRIEEINTGDEDERGSAAAAFDKLFGMDVSRSGKQASPDGKGLPAG